MLHFFINVDLRSWNFARFQFFRLSSSEAELLPKLHSYDASMGKNNYMQNDLENISQKLLQRKPAP